PLVRSVHNIVDHQRYVVKELYHHRGVQDRLRYGTRLNRSVAREYGQRAEILRSRKKLPFESGAHLRIRALHPCGEPTTHDRHFLLETERSNDVSTRPIDVGSFVQAFTS